MTIYQGSRYAFESVERVPALHNNTLGFFYTLFPTPPSTETFIYSLHNVKDGDRFDAIAYQYYGDAELWYVIAYANPEILYPDGFIAGTTLRIPDDPYVF